jgi:8-oxo-dGTP pyrophosphatase MutT (NUDIX family)
MDDLGQRLRLWADELHGIANEGLRWAGDDHYNGRRFERVRRIAAELFAVQSHDTADLVEANFCAHRNHMSPLVGGDAAIFNDDGEILLIQRRDDQLWAMPGGLIEVGETPAEGTCREAWEETGIVVQPLLFVGMYDSRRVGSRSQQHLYHFVFLCQPSEPESQAIVTDETLAVGWFDEPHLPALSPGHETRIVDAFRFWEGQRNESVFH